MSDHGHSICIVEDDDCLRESVKDREADGNALGLGIIGHSRSLKRVLDEVDIVAGTDATVLVNGETGTGKELIAQAIHVRSKRTGPLVRLNCAAVPANLLESELMGHEKGAFTGAQSRRIGRFEAAHEGTIFLDEVGELPRELQPKILRLLQERAFERVGGSQTIRSNARIVAATNRDLRSMVAERTFRADLFYRLNVFPVQLPPLRERPEDIPALARHFAEQFASRMKRRVPMMPAEFTERLQAHGWPGNVRELVNVIERASILATNGVLSTRALACLSEPGPRLELATPLAAAPVPAHRPSEAPTSEATRGHPSAPHPVSARGDQLGRGRVAWSGHAPRHQATNAPLSHEEARDRTHAQRGVGRRRAPSSMQGPSAGQRPGEKSFRLLDSLARQPLLASSPEARLERSSKVAGG